MSFRSIHPVTLVLWIVPAIAAAQPGVHDPVLAELGEPVFERYCASCHGSAGRGDGPIAPALRPAPADLTTIAARRGGEFPGGEIARTIDGRFQITAHGTRAMPVWGTRFAADVPDTGVRESIARGRIATLVEFLKSIQREAGEAPEKAETPAP